MRVRADQTGPLHAGDDAADVPDSGAERSDAGVLAERSLFVRHPLQRHAGDAAGASTRRLLPMHFSIKGQLYFI